MPACILQLTYIAITGVWNVAALSGGLVAIVVVLILLIILVTITKKRKSKGNLLTCDCMPHFLAFVIWFSEWTTVRQ